MRVLRLNHRRDVLGRRIRRPASRVRRESQIMYHETTYTSGHTLYAPHIEQPVRKFEVEWTAPSRRVHCNDGHGLEYKAGIRWAEVLAETVDGAIEIANYHYSDGSNFKLRANNQHNH